MKGENIPLLKCKRHLTPGISDDFTTFINVLKNIVGGSLICIPWMFGILGWVPGTFLLIVSATISWYTFLVFGTVTERLQVKSINQIVLYGWGPIYSKVFDLCVVFLIMSVLVYYLVCVTDWLTSVTQNSISRFWLLTLIVWLIFFPSTIIPNLRSARISSFLGSAAISILIIGVCAQSFFSSNHPETPAIQYSSEWPSMFNVALPAFAGHINAPALYAESINRKNWNQTITKVYLVVFTFTTCFAFAAYSQFGSNLQSNVLNNFPETSFVTNSIRLVMVLNLLCTAPLVLFAFRQTVDPYLKNVIPGPDFSRHLSTGFAFCLLLYLSSMYIPFIGVVPVVLIPVPNIVTTFIVPCATLWKISQISLPKVVMYFALILITFLTGVYGAWIGVRVYF